MLLVGLRRLGELLQRLPRALGLLAALVWALVIWKLSDQPSDDSPPVFWKSWLWNCGHAPLFGFLAFWGVAALPRERGWPRISIPAGLTILALVLGYGIVDEVHQASSPGRAASAFDVATDLVGAACTIWIAAYLGRDGANARGLHLRLAGGLGLCALFGLVSTLAS